MSARLRGPRASPPGPPRRRGFWRDIRGGTAVIFAVAAPVLAAVGCGAADLVSVSADKGALQDAADATALAVGKQLGIATAAGISARANQFALQQLAGVSQTVTLTVTTTVAPDNSTVTVAIDGHRPSFFANLLPPGGWTMHAAATAATLGQLPLCVLSSGTDAASALQLQNNSVLSANGCLVQSDSDMTVVSGSTLQAGMAQAAGLASGPINPTPQSGAPPISDPFASMTIAPPLALCTPLDLVYDLGINLLTPGVHCGNIVVRNGATVTLLPGEHYFVQGSLQMQQNSVLNGSDVALIFDNTSTFTFQDSSQINLGGRRSGPYAGFVIATTRANTGVFNISSTSARQLEGTIYVPNATLAVTGTANTVADQSAWTVVVAKSLQLSGSPNLVINANYAGSQVPVPAGVGPTGSGKVTLQK